MYVYGSQYIINLYWGLAVKQMKTFNYIFLTKSSPVVVYSKVKFQDLYTVYWIKKSYQFGYTMQIMTLTELAL